MKNSYLIALLVCFCSLLIDAASAQDFEVSPAALNFTLEPKEIGTKKIRVVNHSNTKQAFNITVSDMIYDSDGSEKVIQKAGSTERSLANMLNIFPTFFELNPNESREIDVTLSVTANSYDTKWALLHVQSAKERTIEKVDKQLSTGIMVTPRIRVFVMNSPKSNNKFNAELANLVEIEPTAENKRQFSVDIKNTGAKPLTAKVYLLLANINTGKEYKQESGAAKLMPGQVRKQNLPLLLDLPAGTYALAAVLDYGNSSSLEVIQTQITIE